MGSDDQIGRVVVRDEGRQMSKEWNRTTLEVGELLDTNITGTSKRPEAVTYETETSSGIVVRLHFPYGSYRKHIMWADVWRGDVTIESAERNYKITAEGGHKRAWHQFTK